MTQTIVPLQPGCLKGRSVYVATPAGSGKYEDEYTFSLINTLDLLRKLGAVVDWGRVPGCSDLPFARAKIFTTFQRSNHTDFLFVDDDMGWQPIDVVRLLLQNRDFIAGVGPRKKSTREFAFNNCDDHGNTLPITYEADTGVMNVSEVGMAFVCMNKKCADQMVTHYNYLEFNAEGGDTYFAVFDPFIIPGTKRRLPEDYAFCYRWRKIGGKVHIIPDIVLQHAGKAVWSGAVNDTGEGKAFDAPPAGMERPKANGYMKDSEPQPEVIMLEKVVH